MIEKLGVQAYSFRQYYNEEGATEESVTEVFKQIKAMGYDEIQSADYGKLSREQYASAAHKAGLAIIGTHENYFQIRDNTEEMMRIHEEVFGTKIMGVGGLPLEYRESPEAVQKFIAEVNDIGKRIAPYGFKFTYHNHHFEFLRFDNGKTMMDMLYEGLDPETTSFCLDTHWVERGGGCVVSWIEKLAGRLDILHLKDMGVYRGPNGAYDIQPRIVAVGEGNLDWKDIIAAANKIGVKHFCVEYDTPEQPLVALQKSADYLHANFMK